MTEKELVQELCERLDFLKRMTAGDRIAKDSLQEELEEIFLLCKEGLLPLVERPERAPKT